MNEVPVSFGPDGHLVGTLTLPDGPPRPLAVLLCNAGVIHRIGPHRLNVKLARALAAQGHVVMRVDLSGQGDSRSAASSVSFEQQAVLDLAAAMDHAQRATGIGAFALAGICSGAHHGIATALQDERLKALWLMDGYTYATPRTARVRMARQLKIDPARTLLRWAAAPLRLIGRAFSQRLRQLGGEPATLTDGSHPTPPKERYAAMLKQLIDRGVALRIVYSGGMFWRYNHASQWRDAFAAHGPVAELRCDYLPQVDHTVTTLQAQRLVIDSVTDFLGAAGSRR